MTFLQIIRWLTSIVMIPYYLFNYVFNDYAYPAVSTEGAYVFCYFVGNEVDEQKIVDALGHKYGEWVITKIPSDYTTGRQEKVCATCGDKVVEVLEPGTKVDLDPEANEEGFYEEMKAEFPFRLGINQKNLGKEIFFTGKMDGYYGETDFYTVNAAELFLEEADGGYNLYFMDGDAKKYIVVVVSGKYNNFTIANTPSTVWTFDEDYSTLTCELASGKYYLGTTGTYNTISLNAYSGIKTGFPVRLYSMEYEIVRPEPTLKELTIGEILKDVEYLAKGEISYDTYKTTGKVIEVTEAYTTQYKNVSFYLKDSSGSILCFRVKGDAASSVSEGDTITLTGSIQNYNGTIEFVQATIDVLVDGEPEPKPEEPAAGPAEITFSSKDNRTQFNSNVQVWEMNGIKVTNNKAASTNDVADYANPARFYKGSSLTIEYTSAISKIEITTTGGSKYYLSSSINISGATLLVSGANAVIVLNSTTNSVTITSLPNQVRISKIVVYPAE